MKKLITIIFKKQPTPELKPMGTVQIGERKGFNETSDYIDSQIKNRF